MKLFVSALVLTFALPALANHHHGIGHNMKAIAKEYAKLGTQIEDQSKNKNSLKLVDSMIKHSEKALKHAPKDPSKAEKFKTDMSTMITHLNEMKTALLADNNAEAKTHYEALRPWTTPDHSKHY